MSVKWRLWKIHVHKWSGNGKWADHIRTDILILYRSTHTKQPSGAILGSCPGTLHHAAGGGCYRRSGRFTTWVAAVPDLHVGSNCLLSLNPDCDRNLESRNSLLLKYVKEAWGSYGEAFNEAWLKRISITSKNTVLCQTDYEGHYLNVEYLTITRPMRPSVQIMWLFPHLHTYRFYSVWGIIICITLYYSSYIDQQGCDIYLQPKEETL